MLKNFSLKALFKEKRSVDKMFRILISIMQFESTISLSEYAMADEV